VSLKIPVLQKKETIDKHFIKLLEEEAEVNHEMMISITQNKPNRERIVSETLDLIQVGIGILDEYNVTKEDVDKHNEKLKAKGWKFKRHLYIDPKEVVYIKQVR